MLNKTQECFICETKEKERRNAKVKARDSRSHISNVYDTAVMSLEVATATGPRALHS